MTISTEERYLSASQSSNMRVQAEKHGDADVMIAAGWSASRIGGALMRLHSKPTREGLALVHVQVAMEADRMHISNPDAVATAALAWWLDRVCPVCHGRKYDTIPGTPSLSSIECPKCRGTGEKNMPSGARDLLIWLDYCKHSHVGMIKRRLHNNQQG